MSYNMLHLVIDLFMVSSCLWRDSNGAPTESETTDKYEVRKHMKIDDQKFFISSDVKQDDLSLENFNGTEKLRVISEIEVDDIFPIIKPKQVLLDHVESGDTGSSHSKKETKYELLLDHINNFNKDALKHLRVKRNPYPKNPEISLKKVNDESQSNERYEIIEAQEFVIRPKFMYQKKDIYYQRRAKTSQRNNRRS